MKREHLATVVLLAAAAAVAFALRPADADRALAERLIGPAQRIPGGGPPAFRAGQKAVLFFERPGVQGPIRGAIVVDSVTGASVSSRLLIDAVNERLRWWSSEAPR